MIKSSNFYNAVTDSFKNYVNFSGRTSRVNFWLWMSFTYITFFISNILNYCLNVEWIIILYAVVWIVPTLSISVRRLHDLNYSGWRILWGLIPIFGDLVVLYWHCKKGELTSNYFGEPPQVKDLTRFDKVVLIFCISLVVLLFYCELT